MAVVASFTADIQVGTVPLVVQFTDTSTGSPNVWAWTFGTGEGTSSSQSPSHTYTTAGVFTVTLTATLGGDSDLKTETDFINAKTNIITRPDKPYSGVKESYPKDGWENEKNFFVEQSSPHPCVVQYWDLFVETSNE